MLTANQTAFFKDQLKKVKSKIYEKRFPQFKARRLLPVSNEAGAGASSISYYFYEGTGMAQFISDYANLARTDVKAKEVIVPVRPLGAMYDFSIDDIRRSQQGGTNLKSAKGSNIKRAFLMAEEKVAWLGDEEQGLHGLFTHPNINKMTLAADGTGSSTALADKTPEQVLRDLNAIADKCIDVTKGAEVADTMLMSANMKSYISGIYLPNTSKSILNAFLEGRDDIQAIETVEYCKEAGTGATEIIGTYFRNDTHVEFEIPLDFMQHAEQQKGLSFEVPCEQKLAGVSLYYPMSVTVCEGV